jgi:branched-chain amino acid transport system permease protein
MTLRAAQPALIGTIVIAAALIPLLLSRAAVFRVAGFLVLVLFSAAFYLLAGTGGMTSLGQAAFYGLGGYTAGLLIKAGWGTVGPFAAAAIASAAAALVIGYVSLRATGIHFAMLTLSLAQVVYLIVFRVSIFGGDNGLPGIRIAPLHLGQFEVTLHQPERFYYVVLAVVVAALWFLWALTRSSLGQLLRSLREDPVRTAALGVNVRGCQLLAFVVAGGVTGIAGALACGLEGIVTPEALLWTNSALPLIVVLLGGMGSFWGPIVGAGAFEILRLVTRQSDIWMGAVLLVVVLVLPDGLVGLVDRVQRRWISRSPRREPFAKASAG